MIHSRLDSLVADWMKANGHDEISKDCNSRDKCYQWRGTYTATYPF